MPTNELQIVISALDKASGVLGSVGDNFEKVGDKMNKVGDKMAKAGAKMMAVGTGAALALNKGFETVDSGLDAVAIGTGAVGKELDDLQGIVRNVAKTVPMDFDSIGKAVAEVNTRLGLSGEENEKVSRTFLTLSKILGVDVVPLIRNVTRSMLDAGISVEDTSLILDKMLVASQKTGVGVDTLTDKMTTYGVQFRAIGLNYDETIALMSKWEKEGVSTEKMLSGLSMAMGRLAAAGKDPKTAFWELTEEIKNAETEGEAMRISMEVLGARAGPDFAMAVREGRFEIGDLTKALSDADGAIDATADSTYDYAEKIQMLKNDALLALEPILNQFGDILTNKIVPVVKEIIDKISGWIEKNPELVDWILKIIGVLIGAGGLLVAVGSIIKIFGGVISVFGFLLSPVGLVVAAITGLVAIGVLLWQNWDTISAKCSEIWNKIKTTFQIQIEAIKITINGLINKFKALPGDIWNAIKNVGSIIAGVFKNIHIPLPHFKFWTEDKKVGPITVPMPKFDVSWYKEGGIFNKPSLIGVGEAGPEAVVPLNRAGGLGTVNITVTGNTFMGIDDFAEQVDKILMEKLRHNLRII